MPPSPPASIDRFGRVPSRQPKRRLTALRIAVLLCIGVPPVAHAGALSRGTAAFNRGDYVRAFRDLAPLAYRGNAKALGLLGFMYEHGFGAPQAYDAAADFYSRGAAEGDPFAQAMLGLLYDKGHGVPQDFVLAYVWLNLAAAHTRGREQDVYARFRNAVASKMSDNEITAGQQLALDWAPIALAPRVPPPR
jgi:TPR repeat protein